MDHLEANDNWATVSDGIGSVLDYLYRIKGFDLADAYGNNDDTKDVDPSTADWLILHGWGDP